MKYTSVSEYIRTARVLEGLQIIYPTQFPSSLVPKNVDVGSFESVKVVA